MGGTTETVPVYKPGYDEASVMSQTPHPPVDDYIDPAYKAQHLDSFKQDGGSFLFTENDVVNSPYQTFNPSKFVMNGSDMQGVLEQYRSTGDVGGLETSLGYPPGSLQGQDIYVMNLDNPNVVMAMGNEGGTNAPWKPGGLTDPGGMREAVLIISPFFTAITCQTLQICECRESKVMDSQGNLLKRALDAEQLPAFLIGDNPYFLEARQEFKEPQNVSEAMLLQVAPYWRLTRDNRLPPALLDGLMTLAQSYPDQNKALYVCSNWVRTYFYALMKKREQYPLGSYADLFEIDLTPATNLLRQKLEAAKPSLEGDRRWAGATWNSSSGLWGAILSSAQRTHIQFGGPDFTPQNL